jgi:hypothetical protein
MRTICLCGRCLSDYLHAGYRVRRDWTVRTKEPCERCDRLGWVYGIERVWHGKSEKHN